MLTKLFTLPYRLVVVGYPPALTVGEYAPDKRALSVAVRRRFACGHVVKMESQTMVIAGIASIA
jgi:hypothetical protein